MIQDAISRLVALRGLLNSLDRGDVDRELSTVIEELENETPIAPEALEAAGWKPHGTKRGDNRESYYYPNCPISVLKFTHWIVCLDGADERVQVPNCKTMEQLHQLLEMMGVKR